MLAAAGHSSLAILCLLRLVPAVPRALRTTGVVVHSTSFSMHRGHWQKHEQTKVYRFAELRFTELPISPGWHSTRFACVGRVSRFSDTSDSAGEPCSGHLSANLASATVISAREFADKRTGWRLLLALRLLHIGEKLSKSLTV